MTDATVLSRPPKPAPEGWVLQTWKTNFAYHAGPFYFRAEGPTPGVAFYCEPHHANGADMAHGGALMTLADMSLWDICRRKIGPFKAVTLTMNSEFLSPGPIGAFIEASGEMTGGGKTVVMARGLVSADGKPLMSFSGSLRRFG